MNRIKISIFLALFLFSGNSIAQFSMGLDMVSRKEFFQYNDPGNLILPDKFSHLSYGVYGKYVFENSIGTSGNMVHSTIVSDGSARHWLLRFQYNF